MAVYFEPGDLVRGEARSSSEGQELGGSGQHPGGSVSGFKPTHTTSKAVEAHPIGTAEFYPDGSGRIVLQNGTVVLVPAGFASRAVPSEGDMLVRYQDGYLSHCPRDVFDRSAQPVLDVSALSFGQALAALKAGAAVCRKGWNGKGMFVVLVPGSKGLTVEEGRPLARIGVPVGTTFDYLPHIDMWTAQGDFVPWLASQSDMLAEDWMVLPERYYAKAA